MNFVRNLRQFTLSPKLRQSKRLRAAIYLVLAAILYLVFVGNVLPSQYNYHLNDIATSDIRAPIEAIDTAKTKKNQDDAAAKVAPEYFMDLKVEDKAVRDVNSLFNQLKTVLGQKDATADQKLNSLMQNSPFGTSLSKDTYAQMLKLPDTAVDDLKNQGIRIISSVLSQKFSEEDYQKRESTIDNLLVPLDLSRESRLTLRAVLLVSLKPNMVYDVVKTEQDREKAKREVQPVKISKGDLIARKGDVITQEMLQELKDLNLLHESPNYRMYVGFAVFIILLMALLEAFHHFFKTRLANDNLLLLLLSLVIVFSTVVIKTVEMAALGSSNFIYSQNAGYLVPVALGALLATVLFDAQLGAFVTLLLALLTGVQFDFKFQFLFVALISGFTAVFAVSRVKHRFVIMQAGVWIALLNVLAIGCMQALLSATDAGYSGVFQALLFGIINGFLSAVLTIGTLPFLESAFGLLTPVRLLELSDPNHPLLKKLLMEAPGSYHHSLIVGNLAEAAAEEIGANPLLCRVGAYFHDVGKSKRPQFFIENQMRENPHNKLAPSLSHLIITSHVKDGLELLEQSRLPKPIRDICEQHHGTTVLQYFYQKAVQAEGEKGNAVNIDDFRYPGPKPQTKEAAIVMLCDAVEAAVRAMPRPTPNRIEAIVKKILRDRLHDGQLDECNLTLKDLDKAAEAFMRTLNGIYHHRIEYPNPPSVQS